MGVVAVKGQDRIHHVLDHLGACDLAVLRDVSHDDDHRPSRFCERDERLHAGANLAHCAGRGLDQLGPQRLDRVDDHEIGHGSLLGSSEDALDTGLGDEAKRHLGKPEPRGAKANLIGGFLARKVKSAMALGGDGGGGLKEERGFADPGLAAQQHRRSAREPVTHGSVEFADAGNNALHIAACLREALDRGGFCSPFRLEANPARSRERASFLGQAVPRAAGWALALPFAAWRAAGLANIVLGKLHHEIFRQGVGVKDDPDKQRLLPS